MGVATIVLKIRNACNIQLEPVSVPAKVHIGATMLVLPESIVKEFGFATIRKQSVKYANEKTELLDVVHVVIMEVCGRTGIFEAISQIISTKSFNRFNIHPNIIFISFQGFFVAVDSKQI